MDYNDTLVNFNLTAETPSFSLNVTILNIADDEAFTARLDMSSMMESGRRIDFVFKRGNTTICAKFESKDEPCTSDVASISRTLVCII